MDDIKGVTITEIPYKKRVTKTAFVIVCTLFLSILWFLSIGEKDAAAEYLLPFIVLFCGLCWAYGVYNERQQYVYEMHTVKTINESGKPIEVEMLSPNGAAAKALVEEAKQKTDTEKYAFLEPILEMIETQWFRFIISAVVGGYALYLFETNSKEEKLAAALGLIAVMISFDSLLWILGFGLVIGILVWIGGAIASLSIPVAIIIGALIIAGSMKK